MNRPTRVLAVSLVVALAALALSVFTSPVRATRTAQPETSDIGSVDAFALIDLGIMSEELLAVRDEFTAKGDAALNPLYQQDMAYKNQLNSMTPNDPQGELVYQQYQANLNQIQQTTQQINNGYQQLIASQIADLYKKVYAAANEVAEEHGYSYIFVTRATDELIQTDTIQGVTQEILARPLVTPKDNTDLTELVRVKLGFPTREEMDAAIEARSQKQIEEMAAQAEELAGEQVEQDAEQGTEPAEPADQP
ncbi:MAG: hypothetical protein KC996_10170 [Phycisphaerales bacterium]|nr:hypothetical protein [Phycisphaerales bacterium]